MSINFTPEIALKVAVFKGILHNFEKIKKVLEIYKTLWYII